MQQYRQTGKVPSVKELMVESSCFKAFFWITMLCLVVSSILSIVAMSVSCRDDSHKCSYHFRYSTQECHTKGRYYCCGNHSDPNMERIYSCHGYDNCYLKPTRSTRCDGLSITATSFVGLTLLMALCMALTCCCLRRTQRRIEREVVPRYNLADWNRQQGQIIYAPPQPHYAPPPVQTGRPLPGQEPHQPRKGSEERLVPNSPYPSIQ